MPSKHSKTVKAWTRRDFIGTLLRHTAIALTIGGTGYLLYSKDPVRKIKTRVYRLKNFRKGLSGGYPEMVIVHGTDPEKMLRAAIEPLGGMSRFIKRGERVLIKPNAGWDRQPELAATTNPFLVAATVRAALEAGAGEVWVTDATINDPYRCFERSGIAPEVKKAGGRIKIASSSDFLITDLRGEVLGKWPVLRFFHEVDRVINIPIVKHHSLSGCTIAMKNWYGILGGRRNRLHQNIHRSIADLASAVRPTLTIVDAIRVLRENGPTGGSLSYVSVENTIIAGTDEVALDSFSSGILGLRREDLPFLDEGEKRGAGRADWRSLNYREINTA